MSIKTNFSTLLSKIHYQESGFPELVMSSNLETGGIRFKKIQKNINGL
jgi:hypothetical protein